MSLTAHVLPRRKETGVQAKKIKPITEGTEVVVVENAEDRFNIWSVLDDVGRQVGSSVGDAVGAIAQREVDRIQVGTEAAPDNRADPSYQQKTVQVVPPDDMSFLEKNKKNLILGGAAVAGLIVVYLMVRK